MADITSTTLSSSSLIFDDVSVTTTTTTTTFDNVSTVQQSPKCMNATVHQQTFIDYKMAIDVYLVSALCVAGLIGNALSIAVLRRDRDKPNTTNWLLQTLAAVDTVYLVASVLIQPIKVIYEMTDWTSTTSEAAAAAAAVNNASAVVTNLPQSSSIAGATPFDGGIGRHLPLLRLVYPYIEVHAWSVASIAQTVTVWLVMLVTVDRYVAVCMPLKAEWRSLKRAKLAMIVVVVTAVVYNVPRFFERTVVHATRCYDGQSWPITKTTTFRHNRYYFIIYKTISYFVFRAVGPLTAVVVLNVRLVRGLRQVRRRRAKMFGAGKSSGSKAAAATKHHENLTLMLVTVVTVFIVCQLPTLLIRVAVTAIELAPSFVSLNLVTLRYLNSAANALLTLNSAVNFLIYCLIGKKFRRILVNEMCFRCHGRCRCCSGDGGFNATETTAISTAAGGGDGGAKRPDVLNAGGGGGGGCAVSTGRKIAVAGRLTGETEDQLLCGQLRKTMVSSL